MNSCLYSKDIPAYRLGLLSDGKRKAFEEHLRTCTFCQHEMQVEAALDRELTARIDPGDIESFIIAKVRLIKNMQPRESWQYLFQVVSYVVTAMTLLWVFVPMILNLIFAGETGMTRFIENFPAVPHGLFTAILLGFGALFVASSGILTWRIIRD
jgi:anti-sigma factor RsiW